MKEVNGLEGRLAPALIQAQSGPQKFCMLLTPQSGRAACPHLDFRTSVRKKSAQPTTNGANSGILITKATSSSPGPRSNSHNWSTP